MYPKVLIFGQPFNNFSGGGITLTNLFRGWPKNKIAVTFIGHGLMNVSTDVCDTYYQLGGEEHRWTFPFNLIQRKFISGIRSFDDNKSLKPVNSIQTGLRYRTVNQIFYPAIRWLGLFHSLSRIRLSQRLITWLSEFKPDLLYLQVSTRETILFAKDLCDFLRIPVIIHVMDDWPSTIGRTGLLKKYWKKKIDLEFRQLLDVANLHLSISEAMAGEYLKRYHKKFIPFHNPIDVDWWLRHSKTDFTINKKRIKILYSGRIGDNGINDSLLEVASAIDSLVNNDLNIRLHIQTPTKEGSILKRLNKFKCVVINPFAEYEMIPELFSDADILLLANDFDSKGLDYLRFSMPTKASEYMISGSPVLVYASGETAVSQFFKLNNCGYCITRQDQTELQQAILFLIRNESFRMMISQNAVSVAKERFDSVKVRSKFQELLVNLWRN